jgi:hypothetical protein
MYQETIFQALAAMAVVLFFFATVLIGRKPGTRRHDAAEGKGK